MSTEKVVLAALIFAAAIALSMPFIGRAEKSESSARQDATESESAPVAEVANISTADEPQVISVEVTPSGFQPSETIVPRGKFLILLQNRTGRRDLNFWLARENEARVAESEPQKRDWKAHVQLNPGTYIVGETNHPEWKSIIRVTN